MKKNTMIAVRDYLTSVDALPEVVAEINAELAKDEAKAQANRDLYAEAHDVIMEALPTETPVTIAELFTEIEDKLPAGFSKGKVQYAITRMWVDEVVKHEGKTNGYTRKV
jgi:hypothetical protein